MKCMNCSVQILPSYVKVIRENACPACGMMHMPPEEHSALMNTVMQMLQAGVDMPEPEAIKVAAALHNKFDIFPKGTVVDGQVTKEVIYVTSPIPQMPMGGPMGPPMGLYPPQQYQPYSAYPNAAPPPPPPPPVNHKSAHPLATRKDPAAMVDSYQERAKKVAKEENDDVIGDVDYSDDDVDYSSLRSQTDEVRTLKDQQAERLAREAMRKSNAGRAGIL